MTTTEQIRNMTNESIAIKLNLLEAMMCRERDTSTMKVLVDLFNQLIGEQVRRREGL